MLRTKPKGIPQFGWLLAMMVIMLVLTAPPNGHAKITGQIRESILAGQWYPAEPDRLRSQLNRFLEHARVKSPQDELLGLIVPHASYLYSGQVAAYAYKILEAHRFGTIVIIAPSHHVRFKGVSVYDRGGYRTPLGVVPLDHEFIRDICKTNEDLHYVPDAHTREHALEIQLPFMQVVAPESKLVPLVMGEQTISTCRKLARTLSESARDKSVLLIASTDLSHFHSYEEARMLDSRVIRHVQAMDDQGLSHDLDNGSCEACGGGAMIVVLMAAKLMHADLSLVMRTQNSGDITGDHSRVVGYMAASLWQTSSGNTATPSSAVHQPGVLSDMDKMLLHEITRLSIDAHLSGQKVRLPDSLSLSLRETRGAFVTLHKQGRLRGCIGHVMGRLPLAETVSRMAVAAAFQDPRFTPVRPEELAELEYEISVMSPLEPLEDINDLVVGTHGLYIQKGQRSGLLLPQVATEYGWDRKTFLEQTCRKARLPKQAWQEPDTRIFIFSAEVF